MQVFAYFGIILCLAVNAYTRSVKETEGETFNVGRNLPWAGPVTEAEENLSLAEEQCECKNGFCKENDKGISVCTCPSEWGKFSEEECRPCQCGKDSNCTFETGWFSKIKTCLCKVGYEDINGTCKGTCKQNPCQNEGQCVVIGNDVQCRCKKSFLGDRCEEKEQCKCENGFCKENDKGIAVCTCPSEWGNYSETKCRPCECGKDSNCTFETGWFATTKTCLCKVGYEDIKGICKGTCKQNPCQNGGQCVVTGNDVQCRCKMSFLGDRCEEKASFSSSTTTPEGTANVTSISSNSVVSDGHTRNLSTTFPLTPPTADELNKNTSRINLNVTTVFPRNFSFSILTTERFSRGYSLNFTRENGSTIEITTITPTSVKQCKCKNGFCKEDYKGFSVCTCPSEWGKFSEEECRPCKCGKDSNCTFEAGWWTTIKTCLCKVGYEDINGTCKETCKQNPCQNGGQCVVTGNDVQCRCKKSFLGDRCEEKDFCHPNPCKNGGRCIKALQKCFCRIGYSGVYCEQCECENGFCKENDKGIFVCTCPSEWGRIPLGCSPCECGKDSNCTFEVGWLRTTKTCLCKVGYEDINGTCKEIPVSSTTAPEDITNITATSNISVVSGGHTRYLLTTFPPRPSTADELNKNTSRININDTTVFPWNFSTTVLTTEGFSRGHSQNFTRERGSTVQITTIASTSIDLCAVNPCKNGGLCRMEGNEARCYCISPFTGKLCENDPCFLNPCMNGGKCKVKGTSFQCKCSFPHSGRFCEKDPCSENPCQNGGKCFVTGNSFKCICKSPYAGIQCETDPCAWNPCKNGGICKIENEAVKCFCKETFTGEFCDSRSNFDSYIVTAAAASGLLVIAVIFLSCLLCQRYSVVKTS